MIITYEPNFDNAFLQNFISNSFVAFLNYCTPSVPPPHSSLPTHHRRTPHPTDLITATAPLHHSHRTASSPPPHHSSLPTHHRTANSPLLTPNSPLLTPNSPLLTPNSPRPPTPPHHRLRTFCAEANTRWLLKITPATKQTVII